MMRIVVDTNVLVSAILFGGRPAELIRMILLHAVAAVATQEIIEEYQSTIDYLLRKYDSRELTSPSISFVPPLRSSPLKVASKFAVIPTMTSSFLAPWMADATTS